MVPEGRPGVHRRIRSFFKHYAGRICGASVAHLCPWPWEASAAVGVATLSPRAGVTSSSTISERLFLFPINLHYRKRPRRFVANGVGFLFPDNRKALVYQYLRQLRKAEGG